MCCSWTTLITWFSLFEKKEYYDLIHRKDCHTKNGTVLGLDQYNSIRSILYQTYGVPIIPYWTNDIAVRWTEKFQPINHPIPSWIGQFSIVRGGLVQHEGSMRLAWSSSELCRAVRIDTSPYNFEMVNYTSSASIQFSTSHTEWFRMVWHTLIH